MQPINSKQIPGHPKYFATPTGEIWSQLKAGLWRKLKPVRGGKARAYLYVGLGKKFRSGVHQIIALTFLPKPETENRLVVRHKNSNPAMNNVENLAWATQAENLADRAAEGTETKGERNGQSKLTEDQVREIRERRSRGEKCRTIAADFDITYQTVHKIGAGQRWKHNAATLAPKQRRPRKVKSASSNETEG